MPIRPLNTLSLEEVIELLNTPAFYEFFEFAYDMYQLEQRLVQFTTTGHFAVLDDPPAPAIDPLNGHPIGGSAAAPIADFGAPNVLVTGGPISMGHSDDHVVAQAPAIPQQQAEAANAMFWAQLLGGGAMNPGADPVAPFDNEAAPMGPGINVGQDQTLNSLAHNNIDYFTPAQAALQPQLADLGNGSGNSGINDYMDLDLLLGTGTAMYNGTAQEPGAVQHPSSGPLSPAQTHTPGWASPVSDSDDSMGEDRSVTSESPSLSDLVSAYGDLPSEHEETSSDEDTTFSDN